MGCANTLHRLFNTYKRIVKSCFKAVMNSEFNFKRKLLDPVSVSPDQCVQFEYGGNAENNMAGVVTFTIGSTSKASSGFRRVRDGSPLFTVFPVCFSTNIDSGVRPVFSGVITDDYPVTSTSNPRITTQISGIARVYFPMDSGTLPELSKCQIGDTLIMVFCPLVGGNSAYLDIVDDNGTPRMQRVEFPAITERTRVTNTTTQLTKDTQANSKWPQRTQITVGTVLSYNENTRNDIMVLLTPFADVKQAKDPLDYDAGNDLDDHNIPTDQIA